MKRVSLLVALASLVSVLAPLQLSASPADIAVIERECPARLKLPPAGCACVSKKAAALTDGQQAFVAAIMVKDKAAKDRAAKALPPAELTEVTKLVDTGPGECAKAGG